jgi:hypothetical protein
MKSVALGIQKDEDIGGSSKGFRKSNKPEARKDEIRDQIKMG